MNPLDCQFWIIQGLFGVYELLALLTSFLAIKITVLVIKICGPLPLLLVVEFLLAVEEQDLGAVVYLASRLEDGLSPVARIGTEGV